MPRVIDEDVIRQAPVSKAYRDNWDRVFGEKSEDPCVVCGAADHERIEAFGGTVLGCPQVPDGVAVMQTWDGYMKSQLPTPPTPEEVIAACESHPTMQYGDGDAVECRMRSYAAIVEGAPGPIGGSSREDTYTFEVTLTDEEIDALANAVDVLDDSDVSEWEQGDYKEAACLALMRIVNK